MSKWFKGGKRSRNGANKRDNGGWEFVGVIMELVFGLLG